MDTIAHGDYHQRVRQGKKVEQDIIRQLKEELEGTEYEVLPVTDQQDMVNKLDAIIRHTGTGAEFPTQIKQRQTGQDILFEIIKDLDTGVLGRDMKGDAELYICRTPGGKMSVCGVEAIKSMVNKHIDDHGYTARRYPGYEFRQTRGHGDEAGTTKFIGFFAPRKFGISIKEAFSD